MADIFPPNLNGKWKIHRVPEQGPPLEDEVLTIRQVFPNGKFQALSDLAPTALCFGEILLGVTANQTVRQPPIVTFIVTNDAIPNFFEAFCGHFRGNNGILGFSVDNNTAHGISGQRYKVTLTKVA